MSIYRSANIIDYSGKCLTIGDIKQCVASLRNLVLGDDRLKKFRIHDKYLLRFLYCTDFNITEAFKRMQDYHKLIEEHPEWFASSSTLEKKTQIEDNSKAILQGRDKNRRRIVVIKTGRLHASRTSIQEQAQLMDVYTESFIEEPETVESGLCYILDMMDFSWKLLPWLTPSNIKIGAKKLDLYPTKKIMLHIVNTSFLFNVVIKIVWPFLSNKVKDMLKFHFENWPSLYEYIDPGILPSEYGGNGPDIDFEKSNEFICSKAFDIEHRLKCYQLMC